MTEEGRVLVVGGDGTIGAAVAAHLEAAGTPVVRTSHRGSPNSIPLDLAALSPAWTPPVGVTAAVLCAAITSTHACRDRFEECYRVNVTATVDIGRRLVAAGARVIFLSTNMVFDGTVPDTPADMPRCPQTAYGRMKADAEKGLLGLGDATTVVRLTKVAGRTLPVIERWRESLARGEAIRPLADLVMAPLPLDFAATVISAAARESLGLILQVSARTDISYADAAIRLAARWSAAASLVRPATVAQLGIRLEHVPAHTTLDASAVRDRLSVESPDPWAAIDEVA